METRAHSVFLMREGILRNPQFNRIPKISFQQFLLPELVVHEPLPPPEMLIVAVDPNSVDVLKERWPPSSYPSG